MVRYYIGEKKEITSYHYETFVIKNGDKLHVAQTYDNKFFCDHEKGSGVMLHKTEVGTLQELRTHKLEYIETYY